MLTPQNIHVNFSQGLNTKLDPWQLPAGQFLALDNMVFDTGGQLKKRNGYAQLPSLPSNTYSYLTTLNGNLTALGNSIAAYSSGTGTWITKGTIQPLELSTLPLIRNNLNQSQVDTVIAANGLVCTVYTSLNAGTPTYFYAVADSATGQNIVQPTLIPAGSGAVTGAPRVFLLGNYFVIVFTNVISGTNHLQYFSLSVNSPTSAPTTTADVASVYVPATTLSWDGVVTNNTLYIAYNTTTGGQSIKVTYLTPPVVAISGAPATPVTFTGRKATLMSIAADTTTSNLVVYISIYDSVSSTGYTMAVASNLATVLAPTQIITSGTIVNMASAAQNGVLRFFYEVVNNYFYGATLPTNFIQANTITQGGTLGTAYTAIRSVGLASKAFLINSATTNNTYASLSNFPAANSVAVNTLALALNTGILYQSNGSTWLVDQTIYFLAAYQSAFQPTYFLMNGSLTTAASPVVAAKLAYENGGGYLTTGLPSVSISGTTASIPYLNKDFISALSDANSAGTITTGGIYSQTGINLASFDFTTTGTDSVEIGAGLQFSGGFLWLYDGYLPVEHNFFLWPDNVVATFATTGGALTAQSYFYQAVYEWSDNQGNIYRSAGSIPATITTTGSTSAVTINVPTLRLTYKTANPVKITIYRYSAGQEIWYEITSITAPTLNSTTSDSIAYVDTQADSAIAGNSILYTTGGVVEDIGAPATNIISLFDTRLWMVDAEDPNLLWYSKQVIEATPVEMSDLLTFYVAPTTAAQGSTGPITALCPMDDKLIVFKQNAMYYINGTGPDNTGSNNQYSQPIFITSVVGCANQQSIVFTQQGLMFQSEKGIWLLGRDLSTQYIGSPVEKYNTSTVTSAINIPESNQVRFTLDTGETLLYDYFYSQWGTFSGVPAIASCLFQGLHTFINDLGQTFQESPGTYLDGTNPVLMSFTTSWLNLAGVQGYQRAYRFFLLGQYLSPHTLTFNIAYNYNPNATQTSIVKPNNYSTPFGSGPSQSPYGQGSPFGGRDQVENWRVFLAQERCQSFQISMQENYDPSFGIQAGAGLTLSGLNIVTAVKGGWRTIGSSNSVGGGSNRG